jgi:hypothetical protein
MNGIRKTHFLKRDGSLAAIGRRPGVEIDHGVWFPIG